MTWNERWMELASLIATWSKDTSTKVGAVIVDERNNLLALGWNGFPRGIRDDVSERQERPGKYKWTEHAERNAIYNAAASGQTIRGTTIYLQWFPCSDCARAIIQSGINRVVCTKPADSERDARWAEDFAVSHEMLQEANITIELYQPKSN